MITDTSRKPLVTATIIGTVLQLIMVAAGHWNEFVRMHLFAPCGMLISLVAGIVFARSARIPRSASAINGAIAGGACALIGILISFLLGDVPPVILVFGTLSSVVTGAIGGAVAGGSR